MEKNLDVELGKIDFKLNSPSPEEEGVDFFIRYCYPKAVGIDAEGIAVCIHRFKRDRTGTNRLALLGNVYPLSIEGLEVARGDAIRVVKDLYNLDDTIPIIETPTFPEWWANRNYNAIYRVDFMNVVHLFIDKRLK